MTIPTPPFVMSKSDVNSWVSAVQKEAWVIAPVKTPWGDESFRAISSPGEVLWDFMNPLDPPKRFVLPQTDPLAEIRREGGSVTVEAVSDPEPRVFLNLRSCDLKGLLYLRHVHAVDLPDLQTLQRFDRLTLVNLTCAVPCPLGFCMCCGAGPFLQEGFDLQLTDLGDAFLAEVGSHKGKRLVELAGDLFRTATLGEVALRADLEANALRSFGHETCHFGSAMRRISTRRVPESLWEAMEPWCLECGACTLACPTCYCFGIRDRSEWDGDGRDRQTGGRPPTRGDGEPAENGEASTGTRCRSWDSCQYAAFTREASGHNPREEKRERMKRRFHHKVSAQYHQKDGLLGCVGCGRCIQVCMGTTDMPSVVTAIRKGEWEGGRVWPTS